MTVSIAAAIAGGGFGLVWPLKALVRRLALRACLLGIPSEHGTHAVPRPGGRALA